MDDLRRGLWKSSRPTPPLRQGTQSCLPWDVLLRYAVLYHSVLCCKNHTFSFAFSLLFRSKDDTKILSSFLEEEIKMSAFLRSKTTRSTRGTASLFCSIEKGHKNKCTFKLDVL